jgi:hypothetical protein
VPLETDSEGETEEEEQEEEGEEGGVRIVIPARSVASLDSIAYGVDFIEFE